MNRIHRLIFTLAILVGGLLSALNAGAQSSGVYIVQLSVNSDFGGGSQVILTEKVTLLKH